MSFLTSWLLNPLMLGLGVLAVASPIIIHLLNKRRFKIVDWAAMDFLFDADKKNRRRVRLENLILLLLRCLAMLLIGLILARPFIPSSLAKAFSKTQQYELVVLLDDSYSQQVLTGNRSLFDASKSALDGLLNRAAASSADEALTLYLTSQMDRPLISNKPIEADTLSELALQIDEIDCSDQSANLVASLGEIDAYLASQSEDVNRVVYVFTDLRSRDWESSQDDQLPNDWIKKISARDNVAGCFVVDNPSEQTENLAITQVTTNDLLVANTILRFEVTISNFGQSLVRDVAVRLQMDEAPPQTEVIAELDGGASKTFTFPYLFQVDAPSEATDIDRRLDQNLVNHRLHIEIVPDARPIDVLAIDSQYDFAARIRGGIPVLFVDGEPNAIPERSETHFLASTEVQGTGIIADTVTYTEFESVSLSKYQVIFLCNVGEVSADRLQALEQWVRDGGGLVLMPGGQVRAENFNDSFFKEGQGLSPFGLVSEQGDSERHNYFGFDVIPGGHPALAVARSVENVFNSLKIYRWWSTVLAEGQLGTSVTVPLRLTDENHSIAMAERTLDKGRVVGWSFPADLDWTDWPSHPSYAPVFFDLIHELAARDNSQQSTLVGGSIVYPVDLSRYDIKVSMVDPRGEKHESIAQPVDSDEASRKSVIYQVTLDRFPVRGVYQLQLTRTDGSTQPLWFSVNLDPSEGRLARIDPLRLPADYFGTEAQLVTLDDLASLTVSGGHNEIWPQILILLTVVLCLEQFLGWMFGRNR